MDLRLAIPLVRTQEREHRPGLPVTDLQREESAGAQHPGDLVEGHEVIGDMLQNVICNPSIDGAGGERHAK